MNHSLHKEKTIYEFDVINRSTIFSNRYGNVENIYFKFIKGKYIQIRSIDYLTMEHMFGQTGNRISFSNIHLN